MQSITSFLIIYNYDSVGSDLVGCVAEPEWTDGTDEDAIKKQTLWKERILDPQAEQDMSATHTAPKGPM